MTAQTPDTIVLDGVEGVLLATPLDALLAQLPNRPELVAPHTALWRGYVATWRVAGDQLYLDDVRGWIGPDAIEVGAEQVVPGVDLPRVASWVRGSLRVGMGAQVRHVHAGFESRYEQEVLLEVDRGVVGARHDLTAPGAMGMAGPYRLEAPLLGELSGGGFGQVITAFDLDGGPLVAKAPRPTGGGGGTEMWAGDRPVHVPAMAFVQHTGGGWHVNAVGNDITRAVLHAEAELLGRDGGVLLPASYGVWEHDPSGAPVLVMELLAGRRVETVFDVRDVLDAVADAVERGTFDAHGDLKHEHVFISHDGTGRVRVCDPAPRFADPELRAFTRAYNPHGWSGPAADVVACASMLRYLPGGPGAAAAWVDELLAAETPPPWSLDHRAALARLHEVLADPAPVGPFPEVSPDSREVAVNASIDRIVVAAVDIVLGLWVPDDGEAPELHEHGTFADDRVAVDAALRSVVAPSVVQPTLYGPDPSMVADRSAARLFHWAWCALSSLEHPSGFDVRGLELRLPPGASADAVRAVLDHTADSYAAWRRGTASSSMGGGGDAEWGVATWIDGVLAPGIASIEDLVWVTATLVATVARLRREQSFDAPDGLASALASVAEYVPHGNTAWDPAPGAVVARPLRYRLRTLFDAGMPLVWSFDLAGVDRWDFPIDPFDLPIPVALAEQLDRLAARDDLAHPDYGDECVPYAPGEWEELTHAYDVACDELQRALGSAYSLVSRSPL